jgi:hypothetical protein
MHSFVRIFQILSCRIETKAHDILSGNVERRFYNEKSSVDEGARNHGKQSVSPRYYESFPCSWHRIQSNIFFISTGQDEEKSRDSGAFLFWLSIHHGGIPSTKTKGGRLDLMSRKLANSSTNRLWEGFPSFSFSFFVLYGGDIQYSLLFTTFSTQQGALWPVL